MVSAPVGAFLLLLGILWSPTLNQEEATDEPLSPGQTLAHLIKVGIRLLLIGVGGIFILLDIFSDSARVQQLEGMAFFAIIYGAGLLALQRSIPAQRHIAFLAVTFIGFLLWRYAIYKDLVGEHLWGLVVGLVLNGLFWLAIGRHHTPQDKIEVLT